MIYGWAFLVFQYFLSMPLDGPWKYFVCVCEQGGCVHAVLGE